MHIKFRHLFFTGTTDCFLSMAVKSCKSPSDFKLCMIPGTENGFNAKRLGTPRNVRAGT